MKIGIDLDSTINASGQSIEFFKTLTNLFMPTHQIFIITNKPPGSEKIVAEMLAGYEIKYNQIIITENKAKFIKEKNIDILFDNEDRYFLLIGPETTVFKIREEYNFDFQEHKWLATKNSTKLIDE